MERKPKPQDVMARMLSRKLALCTGSGSRMLFTGSLQLVRTARPATNRAWNRKTRAVTRCAPRNLSAGSIRHSSRAARSSRPQYPTDAIWIRIVTSFSITTNHILPAVIAASTAIPLRQGMGRPAKLRTPNQFSR